MNDEQISTTPSNLSASASGYEREEDARRIGSNVLGLIQLFGKYINLQTLDGITLAYNYGTALAELDRGVELGTKLEASQDWAIGVAMTAPVIRNEQVKSHIVVNAAIMEGLDEDPDHLHCQEAVHLLAHECAHVEINAVFDRQFPDRVLRHKHETWYEHLRWEVISCSWDEYAACRISASFGQDPSENYLSVFKNILSEVSENVRQAIMKYRQDSDLNSLVVEAQRNIGNLAKFASYVLGTADGFERSFEKDMPELSAALDDHWFRPFFFRLRDALRELWARYGEWQSLDEFGSIADIWLEMMTDRGLEITPQNDGTMYVNVPFRPETDPLQTVLWGLQQQLKGLNTSNSKVDTNETNSNDKEPE
ncbi:hypothetical protein [Celeribacter neptunius]|uniref:Uncharacterized protein n=1 Tax=Celeribacter neptunius TaxID=588602 RepID=A0A1I3P1Q8_9RHOB|nr:hypothetical protein [Celeribacter neptunius]SFJ15230.1 hypothetical protein SAMN04487991_1532 [Celeribacter neptunius]